MQEKPPAQGKAFRIREPAGPEAAPAKARTAPAAPEKRARRATTIFKGTLRAEDPSRPASTWDDKVAVAKKEPKKKASEKTEKRIP